MVDRSRWLVDEAQLSPSYESNDKGFWSSANGLAGQNGGIVEQHRRAYRAARCDGNDVV